MLNDTVCGVMRKNTLSHSTAPRHRCALPTYLRYGFILFDVVSIGASVAASHRRPCTCPDAMWHTENKYVCAGIARGGQYAVCSARSLRCGLRLHAVIVYSAFSGMHTCRRPCLAKCKPNSWVHMYAVLSYIQYSYKRLSLCSVELVQRRIYYAYTYILCVHYNNLYVP